MADRPDQHRLGGTPAHCQPSLQQHVRPGLPLRLPGDCVLVVSLRGPISRAAPTSCVAAPCPAAGGTGEPAGTRGVFVLNGHRSANRAGFRDVSSELHEVRVRHNSVRNVNGEIVGRIACASLRHEDEVPGTIVGRSRMCGTRKGNKTDDCRCAKRKLPHNNFSEALSECVSS